MFPSYTNNGQRKEQSQTWNTSSWKSNQIKCFKNHFLAKRNILLKLTAPLIAANTPTITRKDSIKANLAMIKISVTNKNYIIITPPVTPSHNISLNQETNESTPITTYQKKGHPHLNHQSHSIQQQHLQYKEGKKSKGKDGSITRCSICESIYHWAPNYPDNQGQNNMYRH